METIEEILREWRTNCDQAEADADGLGMDCFYDVSEVRNLLDRIEKAKKWLVEGLNDGIVERDQYIAKLTEENERIKAALKPVLDIVMDSATSALSMELAIKESKRIWKEGVK